jgi:Eukaryotic DNA topoisomerase I, DNA binding fragment
VQASEPSRQPSEPENKEVKWTTLEHAGVLFPPEYTRLPDNVKLLYEGQPVELTAEQVRGFGLRRGNVKCFATETMHRTKGQELETC